MKKQINPKIKAHLIRSAFYALLLLAVCVIPFALAQRNSAKQSVSKPAIQPNAANVNQATATGPRPEPPQNAGAIPMGKQPAPQPAFPTVSSGAGHFQPRAILPNPNAPQVVLYDQYDNASTVASLSSTFTDFPTFSSDLADDFVVPGGQTWQVMSIDADGVYFNGSGPANDWNVFIYADNGGLPGAQVYSILNTTVSVSGTTFTVNLVPAACLAEGHYWIEIQANMTFTPFGEWGWTDRTVQSNNPAAWQNPGGGFPGCPTWTVKTVCIPTAGGPDQVFRINGVSPCGATPSPTPTATPPTCNNYITSTGTGTITPGSTDTGNHCDDCVTVVPFPFPVTVYGQSFNSASVSSNGSLDFAAPLGFPFTHGCLTLPDTRWGMAILPYQDDLRTDNLGFTGCAAFPGGNCGVFTATTGSTPNQTFYIEWRATHFADNTTSANFELVFYENDPTHFDVIYGATNDSGSDETSGVQASTVGPATTFSCGTSTLTSGLKVTYSCQGAPSPTPTPTGTPGPCTYQVLIVNSDVGVQPVMLHNQIAAESGVTAVDYFDAQFATPTLAQLQPYNIVVAFSNSAYADPVGMGNVLADYADAGGIVVAANFDWYGPPFGLEGRWQTDGYSPFVEGGAIDFVNSCLGSYDMSHPLMQGIGAGSLCSFYRHFLTLTAGAVSVAEYQDGQHLCAYQVHNGHTGVGINAYLGDYADNWTGPFGTVVVNAGRWLLNCGGTPSPTPTPTPTATPTPTPCGIAKIYNIAGFGLGIQTTTTRIYDIPTNTWSTGAPIPEPAGLSDHAVGYWNGKIYIAGGYNGVGAVNTLRAYDIGSNSWSVLAPMPIALYLPGFGVINGKLYVASGNTGLGEVPNLQIYDIATNTWSMGAPIPTPVTGPGSAVYQGKLYVYGGAAPFPTLITTTQVYDPGTNSWSVCGNLIVPRLWFYGGNIDDTSIVAPGGDNPVGIPITANEQGPCPWTVKAPMPYAARGPFAVSDGTYVYIGGGYDGAAVHTDTLRYDPVAQTYTPLAPAPDPHYLSQAVIVLNPCASPTPTPTPTSTPTPTPTSTPTPTPTSTPTPTPRPFVLTCVGRKLHGKHIGDLSWTGPLCANVDIYRDGVLIHSGPNDGVYKDFTTDSGRASYTYRICCAGTADCSNECVVNFGGNPH